MNANVEAGWYLNVSSNKEKAVYPSGATGYDSFNRKIVDSINFYKVSYQGNDATSLPAGISYSQGMGSSTTKYLVEYIAFFSATLFSVNIYPMATFDIALIIAGTSPIAYIKIRKYDIFYKLIFIIMSLIGIFSTIGVVITSKALGF